MSDPKSRHGKLDVSQASLPTVHLQHLDGNKGQQTIKLSESRGQVLMTNPSTQL
jgi:hypothetical protein